jgi:hypothetical protein
MGRVRSVGKIESPTSTEEERQRLERICAVFIEAFEAHPETRYGDRCAIKLDNQRGVVICRAVDGQARGGALFGRGSFI